MEQVIIGGYDFGLDRVNTKYNSLSGGYAWASEADRQQLVSASGSIKQLRVKLNGSPGAGCRYRFTLILNGNPTALTLDIEDTNVSGADMAHKITVTGGDSISLECNPNNNPTARKATWSSVFESSFPKESLMLGGSYLPLSNSDTEYTQISTTVCSYRIDETKVYQIAPTNGTIKNFYVKLSEDPGTAPDAYRFTLRVNGGDPVNGLVVTIVANDISGNDLTHAVDVSAGDLLTIKIEPLNSPSATPASVWGLTFVADIDGESVVLGTSIDFLNISDVEYIRIQPGPYNALWSATETKEYQLAQICIIKKLYIKISEPPGPLGKWTFTVRLGGADSGVFTEIADSATIGNSGVLEDSVELDEYIDLESTPSSPSNAAAYWSLVTYIIHDQSKNLLAKFETQSTTSLKGILTARQSSSVQISCQFVIRHGTSMDLSSDLTVRNSSTAFIHSVFILRHEAKEAIYTKFEIQDSVSLKGLSSVRHSCSKNLQAEFCVTIERWEMLGLKAKTYHDLGVITD